MANLYSSSVTASQVGSYFVQQYYQVLQQQPEFVHQFYTDSSTMVLVDGESTDTAAAILQIHTLVQSLHFSGIEIKTISSLESWSQGIVVVVSGSVKSKLFSGWRKFVQTFFLAPQEKGYFVMNDIFHLVSEEVTHHQPPPVASEANADSLLITSELHVGEDALGIEARENINSLNLEGNQDDYYNSFQETQHLQQEDDYESESYDEETPPNEHVQNTTEFLPQEQPSYHQNTVDEYAQEPVHQNTVEYVHEPVAVAEQPIAEPVKFTYASILRAKGKSSPSVPAQQPTKSLAPAPEWNHIPEPVSQPTPVSFASESTTQLAQESFTSEEGDLKSVYVRNLPTMVTSLEIFQEFRKFGKIKQDGVFLKNRKDVGVCFAFVEFDDFDGVQKAIEASPIQLAGRKVYIEERKSNNSGGIRGGRGRGGGRGRYGGGSYSRGNGFQ